jgi:dTDP-4-dehydrorhamnose 3,5-epimerase
LADITLARVVPLTAHPDHRGAVRETFRQSWFPDLTIKQLVQSDSKPNVMRGMHLHRRQTDVWRFTAGNALIRLFDPVSGRNEFIDTFEDDVVVAIPPGIAHGFYTPDGCTLLYALTEEYTGDDEFGFFPFDGTNDYRWTGGGSALVIILSDRDDRAPRLRDFKG